MPAFPSRSSLFPSGALLPSSFKTLLGDFYDATTGLLGTAGTAAAAREGLNVALPNYLDNPDGGIYQRTVAATADDVYMDDRWYALTETSTITPSQVNNPEDGYRYALRLTQSQASAQRMGRAQIIEGKRTSELRGKAITFGGRAKLSTSANLRVAVLAWTGAEDVVTSDVVNSWSSSTYTTGNFFNSTTLTLVGTASIAMTAATARDVSVSGTVPSNATNIIVLYWTEAQAAQNVTLDAWGMRVVQASTLVDYIRRSNREELDQCKRYQQLSALAAGGATISTTAMDLVFPLEIEMRTSPSHVALNSSPSMRIAGSTTVIAGTWSILSASSKSVYMVFTRTSGTWTANLPAFLSESAAPLLFDANL